MIKYVCRAALVVSLRDDSQYDVPARGLPRLYGVDKKDCWLVELWEEDFRSSKDYWRVKFPNCLFLDPRPDGHYELPEHGFEVDSCLTDTSKTLLYEWYNEQWSGGNTQTILADNLEESGYDDQAVLAELRSGKKVSQACRTMFDMVLTRVAVAEFAAMTNSNTSGINQPARRFIRDFVGGNKKR